MYMTIDRVSRAYNAVRSGTVVGNVQALAVIYDFAHVTEFMPDHAVAVVEAIERKLNERQHDIRRETKRGSRPMLRCV